MFPWKHGVKRTCEKRLIIYVIFFLRNSIWSQHQFVTEHHLFLWPGNSTPWPMTHTVPCQHGTGSITPAILGMVFRNRITKTYPNQDTSTWGSLRCILFSYLKTGIWELQRPVRRHFKVESNWLHLGKSIDIPELF